MRKIVINAHWTPSPYFELSDQATSRLAQAKGIDVKDAMFMEPDRDDPDLVAIVEELGDAAGGEYTKLRVVEIPDDVKWEIRGGGDQPEYVGEVGRTWHAKNQMTYAHERHQP